jgi:hypothetical protein
MTPVDIVEAAFAANLGSVPLSMAAVYAIFGDKFVLPTVIRSETVTSKLRGDVSTHLADTVRKFGAVEQAPIARVALVDVGGQPLDHANISRAPSVDSESFRVAVRKCLDERSPSFDNYWYATIISRRMKWAFRLIRLALCWWLISSLCGVSYFGLLKHGVLEMPGTTLLWLAAIATALPFIVFACAMPFISRYASCIERLER